MSDEPSITELAEQIAAKRGKPDLDAVYGDAVQAYVEATVAYLEEPTLTTAGERDAARDALIPVMRQWVQREIRRDRQGVEIR